MGVLTSHSPRIVGPWTLASLPNKVLYLDSSDASTFTFSSGSVVSQWSDKSAAGNHATQSTVSAQPSRSGTQNGLSTVVFNGSSHWLDFVNFSVSATGMSLFAVVQATSVAGAPRLFGPDGSNALDWSIKTTGVSELAKANIFVFSPTSTTNIGTGWNVLTLLVPGTNDAGGWWLNGVSDSSAIASGASTVTTIDRIGMSGAGGSQFWNGAMASLIVCTGVVSSTDRSSTENYLKTTWGTP